jgi:hypothetical protein
LDAGNRQSHDIIFWELRSDGWCKKVLNTRFEKIAHNGIIAGKNLVLTEGGEVSVYEAKKANEFIYSEYCEGWSL